MAAGFVPRVERAEHGARAAPDRVEHQAVHPVRRHPGRCTTERLIDGKKGCLLPNPGDPKNPFLISSGVSGALGPLEQATWSSFNCAFARLSQIVGLNRVVDTTYRMAHSSYLYRGQPDDDRVAIEPYASFATGANEMSPLDMASGAQTLANNGVHHDPYYVDWVERFDGTRLYTHEDPGQQVIDEATALDHDQHLERCPADRHGTP